ncbi:MAG: restriction endonuclease [Alphaproteobacteria bacterium]
MTTSTFSAQAVEFASRIPQRVILIDGRRLVDLMVEHGVACTPAVRWSSNAWTRIVLGGRTPGGGDMNSSAPEARGSLAFQPRVRARRPFDGAHWRRERHRDQPSVRWEGKGCTFSSGSLHGFSRSSRVMLWPLSRPAESRGTA